MPKLTIDDFTGGRNTLDAVNLIKKNQHSAGSDVWAEFKALSKRRGFTSTAVTISSLTVCPDQFKLTSMAASNLARLMMTGFVLTHDQKYLCYTENGTSFTFAGYRAGTCSTAGSSTTVTGNGTTWTNNVRVGDYFIPASGAANRILAVNSDTDITVNTAVDLAAGTGYKIIQRLTGNVICSFAAMDVSGAENLFVVDGSTTNKFRYNGTDVTYASYLPSNVIAMLGHKNYIFALRTTTIEWCNIGDALTWGAANVQTVTHRADPLRGFCVYDGYIVIWTRSRMFRLLGDVFDPANPTYVLEEISVPKGFNFAFSRSWAAHKGILKFLTTDGWYGYDGSNSVEKLSQVAGADQSVIQPDIDGFVKPYFELETIANGAVAIEHKGRMWCSVPDDNQTNDRAVYVNDERGAWWQWLTAATQTHGKITDFAIVKFGTSGSYQLIGATDSSAGRFLVLDTGSNDAGFAINGTLTSREYSGDNELTFVEAVVTMKKQTAGNLTLEFSVDRAAFVSKTLDMTAGVGTVIQKRVPISRSGKTIRVRLSNNVVDQTFEIYKIEIVYEPSDGVRI